MSVHLEGQFDDGYGQKYFFNGDIDEEVLEAAKLIAGGGVPAKEWEKAESKLIEWANSVPEEHLRPARRAVTATLSGRTNLIELSRPDITNRNLLQVTDLAKIYQQDGHMHVNAAPKMQHLYSDYDKADE